MSFAVVTLDVTDERPDHPVVAALTDARDTVLEVLLAHYDLPVSSVRSIERTRVVVVLDESALREERERET
jgi:hypothetical protein